MLIVLVIVAGAFGSLTYFYYQDSQQKTSVIAAQLADIQNKIHDVTQLQNIVTGQQNQLEQLNITVGEQDVTIQNQATELKKKSDEINVLKGNVSQLSGEVKGLTPVIRSYYVAAVRSDETGAIIPLEVKILPRGSGSISVNIRNVDLQSGAQESIRLAATVASQLSGVAISKSDIEVSFVNLFSNIVSVDGPSAGGAITATLYAALSDKVIDADILMTGTIQADGTIGKIGGADIKAAAAKDQGAKKFLVPVGQKVVVAGLQVVEVATIQDVIKTIIK